MSGYGYPDTGGASGVTGITQAQADARYLGGARTSMFDSYNCHFQQGTVAPTGATNCLIGMRIALIEQPIYLTGYEIPVSAVGTPTVGSSCRFALYNVDSATGSPTTYVTGSAPDAAVITAAETASGTLTDAILRVNLATGLVVNPGWYYIVTAFQGNAANSTFRTSEYRGGFLGTRAGVRFTAGAWSTKANADLTNADPTVLFTSTPATLAQGPGDATTIATIATQLVCSVMP